MNKAVLKLLACPHCGRELYCEDRTGAQSVNRLKCEGCGADFPIIDSIPRFVPSSNYAANFGFQWNEFRTTQLDSHSGTSISRDRFLSQSGWTQEDLGGRRVLDIGCGAGRFAEIALSLGAEVVAIDFSNAVEACWRNLGDSGRLTVLQADIYNLPFHSDTFDFVYCFGVLQHTPRVEEAFKSIPRVLRPGGRLAVDVYPRLWRKVFETYYWLRPLTKHIEPVRLFKLVRRIVPTLLPISSALRRVPVIGKWLRHAIPVSNYEGLYPLSHDQLIEWAVLDTYDMLAPAHDHPQTGETLTRWFKESGLDAIEIFRAGNWVGRGRRGTAPSPLE